jgi:hypothetical protein
MYLSEICNISGSELQTGIEKNTHDNKNAYTVRLQKQIKQTKLLQLEILEKSNSIIYSKWKDTKFDIRSMDC